MIFLRRQIGNYEDITNSMGIILTLTSPCKQLVQDVSVIQNYLVLLAPEILS